MRDLTWREDVQAARRLWIVGTRRWRSNWEADLQRPRDVVLRLGSIPAGAGLILRAGIWGFFAALAESDEAISTGLRRTPIEIPVSLAWAARLSTFAIGLAAIQFIGVPEWGWPAWQRWLAYAWLAPNLGVLLADPIVGVLELVQAARHDLNEVIPNGR
ncbi:hypothetical protein DVK02_15010 [Halobellus sp. Atlit-31R]|nr:hypothetical protein DVK02_15010 [Halobellus sp. Atlit-31R]